MEPTREPDENDQPDASGDKPNARANGPLRAWRNRFGHEPVEPETDELSVGEPARPWLERRNSDTEGSSTSQAGASETGVSPTNADVVLREMAAGLSEDDEDDDADDDADGLAKRLRLGRRRAGAHAAEDSKTTRDSDADDEGPANATAAADASRSAESESAAPESAPAVEDDRADDGRVAELWDGLERAQIRLGELEDLLAENERTAAAQLRTAQDALTAAEQREASLRGQLDEERANFAGLQSDFATLQSDFAALQEQATQLQDDADDLRDTHDELRGQHDTLHGEHDALKTSHAELRSVHADLQDQHRAAQDRAATLESDIEDQRGEFADALEFERGETSRKIEELAAALTASREAHSVETQRADAAETATTEATQQKEAAESYAAELEAAITDARDRLAQSQSQLAQTTATLERERKERAADAASAEQAMAAESARRASTEQELADSRAHAAGLDRDLAGERENVADLTEQLREVAAQLAETQEQLNAATDAHDVTRSESEQHQQHAADLARRADQLGHEVEHGRSQLSDAQQRLASVSEELERVRTGRAADAETASQALHDALAAAEQDRQQAAAQAAERLTETEDRLVAVHARILELEESLENERAATRHAEQAHADDRERFEAELAREELSMADLQHRLEVTQDLIAVRSNELERSRVRWQGELQAALAQADEQRRRATDAELRLADLSDRSVETPIGELPADVETAPAGVAPSVPAARRRPRPRPTASDD